MGTYTTGIFADKFEINTGKRVNEISRLFMPQMKANVIFMFR